MPDLNFGIFSAFHTLMFSQSGQPLLGTGHVALGAGDMESREDENSGLSEGKSLVRIDLGGSWDLSEMAWGLLFCRKPSPRCLFTKHTSLVGDEQVQPPLFPPVSSWGMNRSNRL